MYELCFQMSMSVQLRLAKMAAHVLILLEVIVVFALPDGLEQPVWVNSRIFTVMYFSFFSQERKDSY